VSKWEGTAGVPLNRRDIALVRRCSELLLVLPRQSAGTNQRSRDQRLPPRTAWVASKHYLFVIRGVARDKPAGNEVKRPWPVQPGLSARQLVWVDPG
jgi:hypothetical protein